MVDYPGFLNQASYTNRAWIGTIALSILCHISFFFGVIFLPGLQLTTPQLPSAVEVDLVDLPRGGPQAEPLAQRDEVEAEPPHPEPAEAAKAPISEKPPEKPEPVESKEKPVKVEAPPPKEAVSLAPQPLEVKRSLKKKTYNVSKVIDKAIAKIAKQAPQSRSRSVLKAIDELKKQAKEGAGGVATRGAAQKAGMSRKSLELINIYNNEIWRHKIQKNWAFSQEMARGNTELEAVIIVKIMRNGEIRDLWFEKKSGNTYFDNSALKAVNKSDPLPPLPAGYIGPFYEVGFRFNLSELKRRP